MSEICVYFTGVVNERLTRNPNLQLSMVYNFRLPCRVFQARCALGVKNRLYCFVTVYSSNRDSLSHAYCGNYI